MNYRERLFSRKNNMAMSKSYRVLEKNRLICEIKPSFILESRQKQESILLEGGSVAILCKFLIISLGAKVGDWLVTTL
jgi:hypothetical protein